MEMWSKCASMNIRSFVHFIVQFSSVRNPIHNSQIFVDINVRMSMAKRWSIVRIVDKRFKVMSLWINIGKKNSSMEITFTNCCVFEEVHVKNEIFLPPILWRNPKSPSIYRNQSNVHDKPHSINRLIIPWFINELISIVNIFRMCSEIKNRKNPKMKTMMMFNNNHLIHLNMNMIIDH